VQPALDRLVLDLALGQRHVGVRADVVDRVDLAVAAHDRDRDAVEHDSDGSAVLDVGGRTGAVEVGH
jgi:hypothetical protein